MLKRRKNLVASKKCFDILSLHQDIFWASKIFSVGVFLKKTLGQVSLIEPE